MVTLDGQAEAAAIEFRTSDGKVYAAAIVGTDPLSDLAVIKITAEGLVPATLGDSGAVNVGDSAIAIGAPLGLTGTVTDGIASAGSSSFSQSGNIGVGFSIPINVAKRVAQEIVATGAATHGQLGLSVQDRASGTSEFTTGAEVASVSPGSPAAEAGLKAGDVVTGLAGHTVTDASGLTAAAREQAAGTTVKITFQRVGQDQTADITLGAASAG